VTTTKGAENFREIIKAVPEYKKDKNVDEFLKGYQGEIVVLDPTSTAKFVDLKKLLYYLRHTHNVEFVDVTAGGKVIGEMAYYGLLDEIRLTMAGQVIGGFNPQGAERPRYFSLPKELTPFTPNNSPLMDFMGIRFYGTKHIYLRAKFTYRHLK